MAKQQPFAVVSVKSPPPYRGGPSQRVPTRKIHCASMSLTWSWGCEPGSATLHYEPSAGAPVSSGWPLTIQVAGYVFYGHCISDKSLEASGGLKRELMFNDNRTFLDYDRVFCSFNVLDDHLVNGVRVKRYVHHLPNTAIEKIKSYTDAPYTASEIINFILGSKYILDSWTPVFHNDQLNSPVYNIDAMGGKSLKALLQEITDAQGLLMTLMGGPFRLVWMRKGDITFPTPTPPIQTHPVTGVDASLTDDRGSGTSLSTHPTRICILGDRNLYQIHEIPMVPDWKPGWEAFYDINLFREDMYNRGKTKKAITIGGQTFPIGTVFSAIGSSGKDPEQIISRQLALAESLEISVFDYATLRGDLEHFADTRKFAGKSRLDMPVALYIEAILFRAFRFPDGFSITNANKISIPVDSLEIASKMVARVSHDPITGEMTWDVNQSADGNGYAIVRGYQVGKDLFKTINPDRFRLSDWTDAQTVWEHVEFQIDDSGEPDGKVILFNEPVIKSSNLVKIVNGYGVFNAAPTKSNGDPGFDPPDVKLAVTFAAEQYQSYWGGGTRDEVESVGGLTAEFAGKYSPGNPQWSFDEVPYSDGLFSRDKAEEFAAPFLSRQYIYDLGSYKHVILPQANGTYPAGLSLTPKIDRISLNLSTSGVTEEVEYTTELPRKFYIPERDLDRNAKLKTLLPGQAQLRQQINTAKILAAAMQQDAGARKSISDAFKNIFGTAEPLYTVHL